MEFLQQVPRFFNRSDVEALLPNQNGVYGIFRYDAFRNPVWIYIGKGDIRTRMLAHINGDKPIILLHGPTHWVNELHEDPNMSLREKQLILLYGGLCNDKVG